METARASHRFSAYRLNSFAVSCSGGGDVDSFYLTIEAQSGPWHVKGFLVGRPNTLGILRPHRQ